MGPRARGGLRARAHAHSRKGRAQAPTQKPCMAGRHAASTQGHPPAACGSISTTPVCTWCSAPFSLQRPTAAAACALACLCLGGARMHHLVVQMHIPPRDPAFERRQARCDASGMHRCATTVSAHARPPPSGGQARQHRIYTTRQAPTPQSICHSQGVTCRHACGCTHVRAGVPAVRSPQVRCTTLPGSAHQAMLAWRASQRRAPHCRASPGWCREGLPPPEGNECVWRGVGGWGGRGRLYARERDGWME